MTDTAPTTYDLLLEAIQKHSPLVIGQCESCACGTDDYFNLDRKAAATACNAILQQAVEQEKAKAQIEILKWMKGDFPMPRNMLQYIDEQIRVREQQITKP